MSKCPLLNTNDHEQPGELIQNIIAGPAVYRMYVRCGILAN
jgi:hypothetical protein